MPSARLARPLERSVLCVFLAALPQAARAQSVVLETLETKDLQLVNARETLIYSANPRTSAWR